MVKRITDYPENQNKPPSSESDDEFERIRRVWGPNTKAFRSNPNWFIPVSEKITQVADVSSAYRKFVIGWEGDLMEHIFVSCKFDINQARAEVMAFAARLGLTLPEIK